MDYRFIIDVHTSNANFCINNFFAVATFTPCMSLLCLKLFSFPWVLTCVAVLVLDVVATVFHIIDISNTTVSKIKWSFKYLVINSFVLSSPFRASMASCNSLDFPTWMRSSRSLRAFPSTCCQCPRWQWCWFPSESFFCGPSTCPVSSMLSAESARCFATSWWRRTSPFDLTLDTSGSLIGQKSTLLVQLKWVPKHVNLL